MIISIYFTFEMGKIVHNIFLCVFFFFFKLKLQFNDLDAIHTHGDLLSEAMACSKWTKDCAGLNRMASNVENNVIHWYICIHKDWQHLKRKQKKDVNEKQQQQQQCWAKNKKLFSVIASVCRPIEMTISMDLFLSLFLLLCRPSSLIFTSNYWMK